MANSRSTPKQRVLRKWRDAIPVFHANGFYAGKWSIEDTHIKTNCYSNHWPTVRQAWADAARNL